MSLDNAIATAPDMQVETNCVFLMEFFVIRVFLVSFADEIFFYRVLICHQFT